MNHFPISLKWPLLFLAAFSAFSCDFFQENEKEEARLEVYLNREILRADQNEISVTVFSTGDWTAELSDPSWGLVADIVYTNGKNGSAKITLRFNNNAAARENTLIVRSGDLEEKKVFTQSGLEDYFSPGTLQLNGISTGSVSFLANAAWTAQVVEGGDWCVLKTASGSAGNSTLSCVASEEWVDVGSREARVRITMGTQSLDLSVVQGQKDVIFIADGDALAFDFHEQQFTLNTRENVSYSVSVSDESWIHYASTKALNQSTLSFSLSANASPSERSGEIRLVCDSDPSVNAVVALVQAGRDPILDYTECGFYGIEGRRIVYGEEGWNQRGRVFYPDGSASFRLMNCASSSACVLSGLPAEPMVGGAYSFHLLLMENGSPVASSDYNVLVVDRQESQLWLRCAGSETFFIIQL